MWEALSDAWGRAGQWPFLSLELSSPGPSGPQCSCQSLPWRLGLPATLAQVCPVPPLHSPATATQALTI